MRLECSLCKLCVGACEAAAIDLKPIGDSFVVSIESSGSVAARYLVSRADEIKKRELLTRLKAGRAISELGSAKRADL